MVVALCAVLASPELVHQQVEPLRSPGRAEGNDR